MKKFFFFFTVLIIPFVAVGQNTKNGILLNISGIKEVKGDLLIAFYNDSKTFLKADNAVYNRLEKVKGQSQQVFFEDIAQGFYAVAVIHDANSNGKLDGNFLKIPTELIGTSNNIRNRFGPPLYSDASFFYKGGLLELEIKLY